MKILTKRNAMIGWTTWKVAKGIAKYERAKKSLATPGGSRSRKKTAAIAAAATAAVAGTVAVLSRRKGGGPEGSEQ